MWCFGAEVYCSLQAVQRTAAVNLAAGSMPMTAAATPLAEVLEQRLPNRALPPVDGPPTPGQAQLLTACGHFLAKLEAAD